MSAQDTAAPAEDTAEPAADGRLDPLVIQIYDENGHPVAVTVAQVPDGLDRNMDGSLVPYTRETW